MTIASRTRLEFHLTRTLDRGDSNKDDCPNFLSEQVLLAGRVRWQDADRGLSSRKRSTAVYLRET